MGEENEENNKLKRRIFLLESQVESISRLFEVQAQEMISQNNQPNMYCKQCNIEVSSMTPGYCAQNDCPCGLN